MNDPLRIDWLDIRGVGLVGMTLCPGKHDFSVSGTYHKRDLGTDLKALRDEGVTILVTLVEEHELHSLGVLDLVPKAEDYGISVIRFPFPDGGVPHEYQQERLIKVLSSILQATKNGERVVIHCRAGLGRTGLVAASLLAYLGVKTEDAVAAVRLARARTVENRGQEDYVRFVYNLCNN